MMNTLARVPDLILKFWRLSDAIVPTSMPNPLLFALSASTDFLMVSLMPPNSGSPVTSGCVEHVMVMLWRKTHLLIPTCFSPTLLSVWTGGGCQQCESSPGHYLLTFVRSHWFIRLSANARSAFWRPSSLAWASFFLLPASCYIG